MAKGSTYIESQTNYISGNLIIGREDAPSEEVVEDGDSCSTTEQGKEAVVQEELCHFIYPGLDEKESLQVHRQIKDLVKRFPMKDICSFLNCLAEENKILLPQIPQNAFDELHRMGMPSAETKGFGYDNFCKYYRK